MPGLDISKLPMDLILDFVNIILLFVIVRALVYKPVRKFLDARAKKVSDALDEANEQKNKAEELRKDSGSIISQSEEQARQLIKEAELKAAEQSAQIIANANKQAAEIIEEAKKQIEAEREKAAENIKKEIVNTALIISEKVLEREINDGDVKKLAESYFVSEGKTV